MKWVYNDGGRFAAGYQYHVNDCVCRALSIVTERPYREVQRTLKTLDAVNPRGRGGYPQYLTSLGFEWFPCTDIVHFSADELPQGRIVVQIKEHLAVAAREHKPPGPKTSPISGPHSLRITRPSGPHCVRTGPHCLRTARKHPLRLTLDDMSRQAAIPAATLSAV